MRDQSSRWLQPFLECWRISQNISVLGENFNITLSSNIEAPAVLNLTFKLIFKKTTSNLSSGLGTPWDIHWIPNRMVFVFRTWKLSEFLFKFSAGRRCVLQKVSILAVQNINCALNVLVKREYFIVYDRFLFAFCLKGWMLRGAEMNFNLEVEACGDRGNKIVLFPSWIMNMVWIERLGHIKSLRIFR